MNKNSIDYKYWSCDVYFQSCRTREVLESLTTRVQREFSSTLASTDLLLFILILNSAPSACFLLCLFCSDLYKDCCFFLSRLILKVFCLGLIKDSVGPDSINCPSIALIVSFSWAVSADLCPWLLVFWK